MAEALESQMKDKIQIKKYGNRRLYDMVHKCYITLDELKSLIQEGHEVEVVDSKTGDDLTQSVLIQLILEDQKENSKRLFSSEILHQILQSQDQSIAEFFQDYLPNILKSYINWQEEAQNQFMHWAKLGWSANPYTRDFLMPGLNLWNSPGRPQQERPAPESINPSEETVSEIEALKQKIEALENRLNKSQKRR